ncbi:hypothetical protein pdam_00005493 [Pocillopora damicornis]|uniref:Uncharacterized protein n=1 Tax=Pocillopora damicornis TaxID=46731 RepID=A0A3M6TAN4_POCDA|nr:hypothetical protein pdam_00005493 [Pocillopora damicornis]
MAMICGEKPYLGPLRKQMKREPKRLLVPMVEKAKSNCLRVAVYIFEVQFGSGVTVDGVLVEETLEDPNECRVKTRQTTNPMVNKKKKKKNKKERLGHHNNLLLTEQEGLTGYYHLTRTAPRVIS